jgi:glycosyltransferase involved in cell wall biosynthesis
MTKKPKILFLSHNASRTGAPIMLLNLIKQLKDDISDESVILLKDTGELKSEFAELFTTVEFIPECFYPNTSSYIKNFIRRIKNKIYRLYLKLFFKKCRFDIIYSNTATNLNVLHFLKFLKTSVIVHIHELINTINHFGGANLIAETNSLTSHFIAVSPSCKEMLIKQFDIPDDKISQINNFIINNDYQNLSTAQELRKDLKINAKYIIGCVGGGMWHKGIDLFVGLCNYIINDLNKKEFEFIWVGTISENIKNQIKFDLERLCLTKKIHLTGSVSNPMDYINLFSIYAFTSREDSFGLAGLEALSLGKPVICFDKSGGMPDILKKGGGIIVPYESIHQMGDRIIDLIENPQKMSELSEQAVEVSKIYDNRESIAKQVLKIVRDFS